MKVLGLPKRTELLAELQIGSDVVPALGDVDDCCRCLGLTSRWRGEQGEEAVDFMPTKMEADIALVELLSPSVK